MEKSQQSIAGRRSGPLHITRDEALRYHEEGKPGKIEVVPTKPVSSQYDLALAYSPGVAEPCRAIAADADASYRYTAKGNLVAVVTNGSAVLGLGNIGARAAKPVMEGKGVLFKRFAGIDVFDLEVDCDDPDTFIEIVRSLEPTFGGINLEDIKSPECFAIEEELRRRCSIPVMHDDQHGTAIISGAGLLNGLALQKKRIEEAQIVMLGAGAAALACAKFYLLLGARRENIVVVDRDGVVRKGEVDGNDVRAPFATDRRGSHPRRRSLRGRTCWWGFPSAASCGPSTWRAWRRTPSCSRSRIPDPEIDYEAALASRPDAIVATGRSDWPNQVNNVLGFPFIFRGALDVGAREINEQMKLAAARALAALAREPVPDAVTRAYARHRARLRPRLPHSEASGPAPSHHRCARGGAGGHGVGGRAQANHRLAAVRSELLSRVGIDQKLVTGIVNRARKELKRVVFAEADTYNVLKAAQIVRDQGIAEPVLLGNRDRIGELIRGHQIEGLEGCEVLDPAGEEAMLDEYARVLYEKRQRKGVTLHDARRSMTDRNYFGCAMLAIGRVDALISGMTKEYPKIIRPALQVIGPQRGVRKVAGMYIVNSSRGVYFCADTTVNLNPSVEDLVDIIGLTARTVRFFDVEPVVAVLSYSNFGSTRAEESDRCRDAVMAAKAAIPASQSTARSRRTSPWTPSSSRRTTPSATWSPERSTR